MEQSMFSLFEQEIAKSDHLFEFSVKLELFRLLHLRYPYDKTSNVDALDYCGDLLMTIFGHHLNQG